MGMDRYLEGHRSCETCPKLRAEVTALTSKLSAATKALEKYENCRHACVTCFCTKEARATLNAIREDEK